MTDGRTDQGKNNMSPNPTGGDIITKKNAYSRVMVVVLCTSSNDAYDNTCMKFYEHILNGFKVVQRT